MAEQKQSIFQPHEKALLLGALHTTQQSCNRVHKAYLAAGKTALADAVAKDNELIDVILAKVRSL